MRKKKKTIYTVLFGNNEFEYMQLIFLGLIKGWNLRVFSPVISSRLVVVLSKLSFLKKYLFQSVEVKEECLGKHKGLWHKMNEEAIQLTIEFYDKGIKKGKSVVDAYNRKFKTNKFEAYIKKEISKHIFNLLRRLNILAILKEQDGNILLVDSPVNRFVVNKFEIENKTQLNINWVRPVYGIFQCFSYYMWFFMEIFKRGFVSQTVRKKYKLSMEAAWGFNRRTLRNDIAVDGIKINKKDILILQFFKDNGRQRDIAFNEAKERGFDTACVPKLKINTKSNIFDILKFYMYTPLWNNIKAGIEGYSYIMHYLYLFHGKCFPIEVLMNLYKINKHVSMMDCDDVAVTIILNKYGAKNTIFHWSDLTFYKAYNHAFIAHNEYLVWGDIHYDYHSDNYFIDDKVNIGCIFKERFSKAIEEMDMIKVRIKNLDPRKKIVTFCDTSFSNYIDYTEDFFISYMELMRDFCLENRNVNVLLKPKNEENIVLDLLKENKESYKKVRSDLSRFENFIYLDLKEWDIEEVIAISDVCVNMGMNSPSTIALICGKDALYYDETGNVSHPFALKYKDKLVFDDKNLLFAQIRNILGGEFSCKNILSTEEIREYDAFEDNKALDRLRERLSV